ncbi:MAG: cyclophilin-like fold protein [Hyphomicrobiaceae bacterium]
MKKPNHAGMGVSVAFIGTMALSLAGSTDALGPAWAQALGKQQKIRISGGGQVFNATLADNETARDFASLLPLTLTMSDLFGREKTAQLPRAISTAGPRSHIYEVGDVILWSPRPSVAIFYRHDGQTIPSPGSILIAKADAGVEALNVPGSVNVTIDRVEE